MRSRAFAMGFSCPATSWRYGMSPCPRLCFAKRTPNAACQTSSEARLYAAHRRLRGHSAPAAFSSVRRAAPAFALSGESQMLLARLLSRHGCMPLAGVCAGTPRRQRFRRHSAPRSRPFLVPGKTPYRAGLPFSHIAAAWPRVDGRMFYESTQKCRWFRHAATIPAKGRLRVISNLGSAEMALAKALPDADGRCGK